MLSRVYLVLDRPRDAVGSAKRCQEIAENYPDEMKDFDLAYAQEALARAYALKGDRGKAREHLKIAENLGQSIQDKEDKKIFLGDLNSGDWFGIK